MLFDKLFEKSFEYSYFDTLKKEIIRSYLNKKEIEKLSQEEFFNDNKILLYHISQLSDRLSNFTKSKLSLFNQKVLQTLKQEIILLKETAKEINELNSHDKRLEKYNSLLNKFRELFKTYISLITNQSWQSPDFGYSLFPQHGIFQEKVYSFYNDYQRYRINTTAIEENLNSVYQDIYGINHKTWLFNSGMGAFNTLLQSLPDFHNSCKLAGNNLYFEIISFLKYQKNIFFFHEKNTQEIINFVKENNPEYIFLDPVANSGRLIVFNFNKLFDYFKNNPPEKPVSIIIDTTLTIHLFQIAEFFPDCYPKNLNIFLYRSLQKLDQCGLDLVTGGIITHYGNLKVPLDSFRQLGTTPTETEILTLEHLGKDFTEIRFIRHGRNALIIANFLNNLKSKKESIIESVFHPLLKGNRSPKNFLQTPLLFFSLKDHFNLEDCNFFLKELIRLAKIRNINLIAGTSFGFNFSRIMITSFPNSSSICFRFSPGTEVLEEIYKLLEILKEINDNFILNLKTAYEKREMILFQNKLDLYNKILEEIISEKQLESDYLNALINLIYDINSQLIKFKNYKVTKKFYNEEIGKIVGSLLQISNRREINLSNDIKKEIIRSIAALLKTK